MIMTLKINTETIPHMHEWNIRPEIFKRNTFHICDALYCLLFAVSVRLWLLSKTNIWNIEISARAKHTSKYVIAAVCFRLPWGYCPGRLGGNRSCRCQCLQRRYSGRRCAGSASSVGQSSYLWSLQGGKPHAGIKGSLLDCCCTQHMLAVSQQQHSTELLRHYRYDSVDSMMRLLTALQNKIIYFIYYDAE